MSHVHKIYILILLCVLSFQLNAQNRTDSLLSQARNLMYRKDYSNALRPYLQAARIEEKQNNQTKLAQIYREISDIYEEGNLYEKSLEYLQKAYQATPNDEISLEMADLDIKLKKYNQALANYGKVLNNYEKKFPNEPLKRLPVLRKIIIAFQNLNEYESALENNFKILEIQNKLNNTEGIIIAKNNIGYTYKHLRNYNMAIKTFEEVLKLEKTQNKINNPTTLINIGVTYQNIGDYENTLKYLLQANKIIEKTGNKREMAQMYDLLSSVYYNLKDYYNARYYNDLAQKLANESNDKKTLSNAYQTTSLLFQQEEKYDKALEYFKKHLEIKDSLLVQEKLMQQEFLQQQFIVERSETELKLLLAGEEIKDAQLKEARAEAEKKEKEYKILQQSQKLKDEQLARIDLEQKRSKQELLILQNKAETEKKDRAIIELQRTQAIKDAEIMKKSALEKEKEAEIRLLNQDKQLKDLALKKNQEEIARQNDFQNFVMGAGILGALIFILILVGLIITRKKNQQLAQQQKEIEQKNIELAQNNEEIAAQRDTAESLGKLLIEKNDHIIGSINYAKQIQEAILPLSEEIEKYLPQHFILFKPRDIVSGDFYFFAHKNNQTIIAAIDCTGHGVPGALMSMVGSQILNEIIAVSGITEPDQILNVLHKEIRKALKQEETHNRDGMDMALININHNNQTLSFAGAKNPMIFIDNGELHHIKGDRTPIGGEQKETERIFTKHTFELKKDMMIYLFSDGYQDQFGGNDRKKFMIANMKKMFLDIYQKPMLTQKEILKHEIEVWINDGSEVQTDDILVMGVRV